MKVNECYIKLDIEVTNVLKCFAFIIVIISHYFRYYAPNSTFSFLSSSGFFGAALFAFLSGYGVTVSFVNKGFVKGYLRKNLIKFFCHFVLLILFRLCLFIGENRLHIFCFVYF